MRKICLYTSLLITIIFFTRCVSENVQVAKDIKQYLPPVPPSFSSVDSAQLIKNWTIGIKFYKSNCARCHGIFGNGKDSIPNFSKEQMDDYKAAALGADKQNHTVMSKMTGDELDAVFLFITNVKRE